MTHVGQKAKDAKIANQSLLPCNKGQKVNNAELIPSIVIISTSRNQNVEDVKSHAKNAMKKTCTSLTIKLFAKGKDAKEVLLNL